MNIAFLGASTDDKKFFLLCLARVMSFHKKAVIYAAQRYTFDEDGGDCYDYCGVEIHQYNGEEDTITVPEPLEADTYCFFDIDHYIPFNEDFRAAVICEAPRILLEESVRLAGEYSWINPSLNFSVIYLNLMEYCRVSKKYLDIFWERSIPSFTILSEAFPFYFEESNRVVMLESQYSDRLPIKALTPSFKNSLSGFIQSFFGMDHKQAKSLLKMAEREK